VLCDRAKVSHGCIPVGTVLCICVIRVRTTGEPMYGSLGGPGGVAGGHIPVFPILVVGDVLHLVLL